MSQHPQWFQTAIARGFQRLICLNLERQPAAEMIEGTTLAWCSTLWPDRTWDERLDAPRIARAFHRLSAEITSWPAPRAFINALPPREITQVRLTNVASDATRIHHMTQIGELLGGFQASQESSREH